MSTLSGALLASTIAFKFGDLAVNTSMTGQALGCNAILRSRLLPRHLQIGRFNDAFSNNPIQ